MPSKKRGFHFLSLSLGMGELWRIRQFACPLPDGLIHVDSKKAKRFAGALSFSAHAPQRLRVPM